jgi:hypothetical protein
LSILLVAAGSGYGGEGAGVPTASAGAHFIPTEAVQRLIDEGGPNSRLAKIYIGYATDLVNNVAALDKSVAVDVQLHDLEPQGFKGLAGLKAFRMQRNAAFTYDKAIITAMRFPAPELIEVDVCTERTDTSTGNKRVIFIYAKNRWVKDKLVERWDSIKELPPGSRC